MKMKIVLSNFNYSTTVHGTKIKNCQYWMINYKTDQILLQIF